MSAYPLTIVQQLVRSAGIKFCHYNSRRRNYDQTSTLDPCHCKIFFPIQLKPRRRAITCPHLLIIVFAWNCCGLGRPVEIHSLRALIRSHRPSIFFLSKLRSSSLTKIQRIFHSLSFYKFEFALFLGRASGLILCWKDNVDFKITIVNHNLISDIVCSHPPKSEWVITWVYGPTIPGYKLIFWDQLKIIIDV